MSYFREKFVKHSQKVRRCVGCDNFETIGIGDPYWSCFSADGGDVGYYCMCEPCRTHVDECKECEEAWRDAAPNHIYECRKETERQKLSDPTTKKEGEKDE